MSTVEDLKKYFKISNGIYSNKWKWKADSYFENSLLYYSNCVWFL